MAGRDRLGDRLGGGGGPLLPADRRELADAALRVSSSRVFGEATEFVITAERLERAYGEIESALFVGRGVRAPRHRT